jgi:Rad3-related DNA helicase
MNFMSAFDIAARVAHRVLGLSTSERQAAWQHDRWARSVSEVFDGFESVFAEGPDRDALAVLRTLRNSIPGLLGP